MNEAIPACWAWPVTEAEREQARRVLTAATDLERDRVREELLIAWHAGRCAICGMFRGKPGRGRLVWDHQHETGDVRGLLCGSCNASEPHARTRGEFLRYRIRPPAAILGVRLAYAEPTWTAELACMAASPEALQRWQEQNDPARRR